MGRHRLGAVGKSIGMVALGSLLSLTHAESAFAGQGWCAPSPRHGHHGQYRSRYRVVKPAPHGCAVIQIGGGTYDMQRDRYARRFRPYGFEGVAAPSIVTFGAPVSSVSAPPVYPGGLPSYTMVKNVPNANGSYTPVTLRRVGGMYVGPRGEYYVNEPTVEQLRAAYGIDGR